MSNSLSIAGLNQALDLLYNHHEDPKVVAKYGTGTVTYGDNVRKRIAQKMADNSGPFRLTEGDCAWIMKIESGESTNLRLRGGAGGQYRGLLQVGLIAWRDAYHVCGDGSKLMTRNAFHRMCDRGLGPCNENSLIKGWAQACKNNYRYICARLGKEKVDKIINSPVRKVFAYLIHQQGAGGAAKAIRTGRIDNVQSSESLKAIYAALKDMK